MGPEDALVFSNLILRFESKKRLGWITLPTWPKDKTKRGNQKWQNLAISLQSSSFMEHIMDISFVSKNWLGNKCNALSTSNFHFYRAVQEWSVKKYVL